jgi:hypothetical protein
MLSIKNASDINFVIIYSTSITDFSFNFLLNRLNARMFANKIFLNAIACNHKITVTIVSFFCYLNLIANIIVLHLFRTT